VLGSQTFLVPVLSPKGQHLTTRGLELPLGHCLSFVIESPFEVVFNTNAVALGAEKETILASLATIFETVTSSLTTTLVLLISAVLVVEFSTI
jgi:hypothetical protein